MGKTRPKGGNKAKSESLTILRFSLFFYNNTYPTLTQNLD